MGHKEEIEKIKAVRLEAENVGELYHSLLPLIQSAFENEIRRLFEKQKYTEARILLELTEELQDTIQHRSSAIVNGRIHPSDFRQIINETLQNVSMRFPGKRIMDWRLSGRR